MKPHARDVSIVLVIEHELKHGLANATESLIRAGEDVTVRHVTAALSTFFATVVASLLPPESWPAVFDALRESIPEMKVYRADYLAEDPDAPAAQAPADPDAN